MSLVKTLKIQIGDSLSTDWLDSLGDQKTVTVIFSDMNVASKDVVEGYQVVTIIIDIPSTSVSK